VGYGSDQRRRRWRTAPSIALSAAVSPRLAEPCGMHCVSGGRSNKGAGRICQRKVNYAELHDSVNRFGSAGPPGKGATPVDEDLSEIPFPAPRDLQAPRRVRLDAWPSLFLSSSFKIKMFGVFYSRDFATASHPKGLGS
jgi:hypothetical protein